MNMFKIEYIIGGIIVLALAAGGIFYLHSQTLSAQAPTPIVENIATTTESVAEATTTPDTTAPSKPSEATPKAPAPKTQTKPGLKKAAELAGIEGYINTNGQPIHIKDFLGKKVVLIDIWTYSCINCQRTLPYVKDWYNKYSDKGLEIIGVHTPEFSFEKVLANVQKAVTDEGIKYPVVLDNTYKTWNAFGNQYWPRKYLIDIDGYIVYDHAGEGEYAATEAAIQKALAERSERLGTAAEVSMPITPATGPTEDDLRRIQSPETYFGSERNDRFGNGTLWTEGDQTLTIPATLKANAFYLSGTWNFAPEYATSKSTNAEIRYTYNAKGVYFVAASASPVKIKITRDGGKPLGSAAGADVNAQGEVTIQVNRLYKLIDDSSYGTHTLEIHIEGAGLKAYTFTFG